MKAIVVEEYGGSDKLIYKDIQKPTADKGTVVVKNHSIGKAFLYISLSFFFLCKTLYAEANPLIAFYT